MKSISCFYKCCSFFILLSILYACDEEYIPCHPIISYDNELSLVKITQSDTLAKDTAVISIDGFLSETLIVKDSISYSIDDNIKKINQLDLAYYLINNNNELGVKVSTKRGLDTSFVYKFKEINIEPIMTAKVLSGNCVGLYDKNSRRDYHEKIRRYFFENNLHPDSSLIESMNNLMIQFNYSWLNEYSSLEKEIPVVRDLNNLFFTFESSLPGNYFYLYACNKEDGIKSFVKDKIAKNFEGAVLSSENPMKCSNPGRAGINVLLLIAIDNDWKYNILPVGLVEIDNVAPEIFTKGLIDNSRWGFTGGINPTPITWPAFVLFNDWDIKVNIPSQRKVITSSVTIRYGSFRGNDHFGYDVPFYIHKYGDLQSFSIGKKTIMASSVENGKCIRVHLPLRIGDNDVRITATDIMGNTSSGTMSIPIVSYRINNSYDDDEDDYDELEDRISDLESQVEELEDLRR